MPQAQDVKTNPWIAAVLVLVIMALLGGGFWIFWISNDNPYRYRAKPRRIWKDRAIAAISSQTADTAWIDAEIAHTKAKVTDSDLPFERWLSPHVILMKNGEWIAYTNICRKQDSRINDIFIGRASDGKWYYLTYHFCIRMYTLAGRHYVEGQPENITRFAREYYLREFDGKSDDCLQRTWILKRR